MILIITAIFHFLFRSIDSYCVTSTITTTTSLIQTTISNFFFPGSYGDACSTQTGCIPGQYLECLNRKCECTDPFPIWAQFSTSCVSCPAGWEFSSYRCVTLFDESVGDYDECADMCSNTNDGVMYKFHDVYDLKSVLAETIPSEGLYINATYLGNYYFRMANSFFDISVNDSPYWCNELTHPQSYDCLIVIPKSSGTGNCLYSSVCTEPRNAICECDTSPTANAVFNRLQTENRPTVATTTYTIIHNSTSPMHSSSIPISEKN